MLLKPIKGLHQGMSTNNINPLFVPSPGLWLTDDEIGYAMCMIRVDNWQVQFNKQGILPGKARYTPVEQNGISVSLSNTYNMQRSHKKFEFN